MSILDTINDRPQLLRLLQIVALVVVTLAFSFFIYWLFFRTPTDQLLNENINGVPPGGLPNTNAIVNRPTVNDNVNGALPVTPGPGTAVVPDEVASGRATKTTVLSPTPTDALSLGPAGTALQYYDRGTGQFFRLSLDGRTKQLLSSATFASVQNVTWSPDGNKAIMEFPDRTKILYDFSTRQQVTLPEELEDFSFSPDSNKMAFKFLGATEQDQWLAVANPDGSNAQVIEVVGDKAPFVDPNWSPNQQIVATFAKSVGAGQQEIVFLGQYNENFKTLTVNGRGFQSQWSPAGDQLLYSVYSGDTNYNPTLHVTLGRGDSIGQGNTSLNVQTWPDKCAFGGTGGSVICAVPTFLPTGAGIQREIARGTPDELYEINLATGTTRLLAQPVSANGLTQYAMTNLRLSANGEQLFFVDETSGQLLSLRLR